MRACVIIGDIVKSQKLPDLAEVIGRLREALDGINREYADEMVGRLAIFGGDSFEGALCRARKAYDIYRRILIAVRPARVRCVAAIGEINDLADGNVLEMTGPVFTRASDALAEISKARRQPKVYFRVLSDNTRRDRTVNTIAMLIEAVRRRWKDRAYQIAEMRATNSVEETAELLGLTRVAVGNQIRRLAIDEVGQAEAEIRSWLESIR